jgi:hypothetical protein
MPNHRVMKPNNTLENREFFEVFHTLHNVVWDQLINKLYEEAHLVFDRNYELNTISTYRRFQLLFIVTKKLKVTKW